MPLSSQRQRVSIFVSPRNEDFLFYEKVDKQRVQESVPEYGDPHPDYRKYPNHFFAQAVQADDEGQVYYYYYAAKREHQDDYNFEHTTVNHKSGTYDQVERSYITLRSEYDEDSPALGSPMPIVDADPFEETDQYTLISREQSRVGETVGISSKRNPDEMDSMFVIERRIYLKRVPITTTTYDKNTGAHIFTTTTLLHRDEIPEGSTYSIRSLLNNRDDSFWDVDEETGSHQRVEQVSEEWFYVSSIQNGESNERRVFLYLTPNQNDFVFYELVDRKNEKVEPNPLPEFGDTHPEFPQHKFVAAVPNDNIGDFYKYYYAADRFNEDQYNFSEAFVDIGGVRVSLVRRSYVTLRDNYDPNTPEVGAPMPADPDNKFTGDYRLVDRIQRPIEDETLSSLYVSEERVYAKAPTVSDQDGNLTLQEGGLTVTRTWVVPRDQVAAYPTPTVGTPDSKYGQYKYATRRISQDTPAEIDSYFSVVLDIYARKEWAFREEHQYNIGYKIIETTTLEDDKEGDGNYTVSFDERGWQRRERSAELTGFEFISQVETRPYGKITTNRSAGTEPIVGQNNTRSSIVFDDGTLQIYQRDEDTFTVKEGSAGQEKNEQIYASITTNKFYRTSGDVSTDTGSSRVIYDDGTTQVYEVSEEYTIAKIGDAGESIEEQIYATITTNSRFSQDGTVYTETGRSRVVYRGGGVIIYQVDEESVEAKEGDAGESKEEQIYATITTNSRFSQDGTVNTDTGRSRVVYRGGGVIIYQVDEESVEAKEGDAGESKEEQIYATITTNSRFSQDGTVNTDTGRSRVVYRGGGVIIYQVDEESVEAKEGDAGESKEEQIYATITTNSRFSQDGTVNTDTGRSRVVYRGGGVIIYQVDEESVEAKEGDAGESKEEQIYATITTNSRFSQDGTVNTDTGRSRVVYRGGGVIIYQVDEESVEAKEGDAGESKEEQIYATITTNSRFSQDGTVNTDTGRSRVVYRGGGVIIYQVDEESVEAKEGDAGESKEEQIYATITTNSRFSQDGTVNTDTGRSRVVYRGGGVIIYQVDEESVEAKEGDAGESKEEQIYATITTNSRFSQDGTVNTDTGRSRVVYRGGGVIIYQVDEESVVAKEGDAGESKEEQIYATITTNSRFSQDGTVGTDTGRSRVVYRGGGVIIYQVDEESVVAKEGDAGQSKEEQIYATITTNSKFSQDGTVGTDTGRSRVVYRGGGVIIYQVDEESVVAKEGDAGQSKEEQIYATITTNSKFSTSSEVGTDTGRSRVVYRGGGVIIYQVDEESVVAKEDDAGESKEARVYGTLTTASKFSTSSEVGTDTGRSRIVYRGGGEIIYQVDEESLEVEESTENGTTKEANIFATITTESHFETSGDLGDSTGNSRLVYNDGSTQVYQVDKVTDIVANEDYTYTVNSSVEWGHLEIRTYFNSTGEPEDADKINRVRVVYRGESEGSATVVFQIDEETPVPNTTEFTSAAQTTTYFKSETFTKYDTTPNNEPDNNEEVTNRAVYNNVSEVIYRVDRTVFTPEPAITYHSTVTATWPAVLGSLDKRTWERRDGTEVAQYVPKYSREGYRGPCASTVTETWTKSEPAAESTVGPFLQTSPIIFVTPIFQVNIKDCLHGDITFVGTTGTGSAEWEYLTWDDTFPATPQKDWVDVTITDEVSPFQGGFLRRTVVITPPI